MDNMRIAFVGDCRGKVHYNRFKSMSRYSCHAFRFFTTKDNLQKISKRFDAVYYASFVLYDKAPIKHHRIFGSATSWKCIYGTNRKSDAKLLSRFSRVSANNRSLAGVLHKYRKDIMYIPNGVEEEYFCPALDKPHKKMTVGWVGNKDRRDKNYDTLLGPIIKLIGGEVDFRVIATHKSDPVKLLRGRLEMRNFYRSLTHFLITSSCEGTPNSALEAAACGVPLISTRVGNMPELIRDEVNGWFVDDNVDNIVDKIMSLRSLSCDSYRSACSEIRSDIVESWTWKSIVEQFDSFFGGH